MSKATLVSFYPQEFDEAVPHIQPPTYKIPASDGKNPQFLVISDGIRFIENWIGDTKENIPVSVSADELAYSLVYDFRSSLVDVGEDAYPAVFALPGEVGLNELVKNYQAEVEKYVSAQRRWLSLLVKKADDLWEKHHQYNAIGSLQRIAAKTLNLDREWLGPLTDLIRCPSCNHSVSSQQAVCDNCRCIINEKKYKELKFATV